MKAIAIAALVLALTACGGSSRLSQAELAKRAGKICVDQARTIAHPGCPANIRGLADFLGGTEAMLRYVDGFAEPTDFLVATEANTIAAALITLRHIP